MADSDPPRDEQGRFVPGGPGGPGRPRGSTSELRRAAEEAVTPEHVAAMIRKAAAMALQGNLTAMRLVLERTCGRPREATSEGTPLGLVLPRMDTASACNQALQTLSDAIVAGTVDTAAAKTLIDVIQARLKAIEVQDLEARLADLEKQAAIVEVPRNGRRF